MSMKAEKTVRELALENTTATRVFEKLLMVGVLDVRDQVRKGLVLPVPVFLRSVCRLLGHLQRIDYLIYREVGRPAGLVQRLVASATVVNA